MVILVTDVLSGILSCDHLSESTNLQNSSNEDTMVTFQISHSIIYCTYHFPVKWSSSEEKHTFSLKIVVRDYNVGTDVHITVRWSMSMHIRKSEYMYVYLNLLVQILSSVCFNIHLQKIRECQYHRNSFLGIQTRVAIFGVLNVSLTYFVCCSTIICSSSKYMQSCTFLLCIKDAAMSELVIVAYL